MEEKSLVEEEEKVTFWQWQTKRRSVRKKRTKLHLENIRKKVQSKEPERFECESDRNFECHLESFNVGK